jgi:hypothetical protein
VLGLSSHRGRPRSHRTLSSPPWFPWNQFDTHHPLKTARIRGFWPRYARLKTPHPPKDGQQQPGSTPTHPPADSEVCYHNYTALANEQGPAATAAALGMVLLGISDPFGSSLLPANPAGGSSSGSFRPVAVHGNKDGALAGGL